MRPKQTEFGRVMSHIDGASEQAKAWCDEMVGACVFRVKFGGLTKNGATMAAVVAAVTADPEGYQLPADNVVFFQPGFLLLHVMRKEGVHYVRMVLAGKKRITYVPFSAEIRCDWSSASVQPWDVLGGEREVSPGDTSLESTAMAYQFLAEGIHSMRETAEHYSGKDDWSGFAWSIGPAVEVEG